jgi:hypothetical protein
MKCPKTKGNARPLLFKDTFTEGENEALRMARFEQYEYKGAKCRALRTAVPVAQASCLSLIRFP